MYNPQAMIRLDAAVLRLQIVSIAILLHAGAARGAVLNDFLPGARPMGMGMAYTAVAEGPEAMFFNPAGLAGSDFTQIGGGMGRLSSDLGPLSFYDSAYTRPLPILPGSTVGAGFFSLRESDNATPESRGPDKDAFLLHFSYPLRLPQVFLRHPLKLGGNFKFLGVDTGTPGSKQKMGLGLDAGALVDSGEGLKFGLSVTDWTTKLGVRNPSLNMGLSCRLKRGLLLAGDLRVRSPRLAQFFPGVEAEFFQQLLKVRVGKGFPLDGAGQAAFGLGVNFSPVFIDFAMLVPWQGLNRPGGGAQLSAAYKFGAPAFYGRFVGTAARRAEDLRSEIAELEEKKKTLDAQAGASEADRTAVEGQVRTLQERHKELQDKVRETEFKLERAEYDLQRQSQAPAVESPKPPPPEPKPKPPPPGPSFPRKHVVHSGETLRSIAKEHYNDPSLWETVFEANPDKVERGMPVEGAVLTIPAPEKRKR